MKKITISFMLFCILSACNSTNKKGIEGSNNDNNIVVIGDNALVNEIPETLDTAPENIFSLLRPGVPISLIEKLFGISKQTRHEDNLTLYIWWLKNMVIVAYTDKNRGNGLTAEILEFLLYCNDTTSKFPLDSDLFRNTPVRGKVFGDLTYGELLPTEHKPQEYNENLRVVYGYRGGWYNCIEIPPFRQSMTRIEFSHTEGIPPEVSLHYHRLIDTFGDYYYENNPATDYMDAFYNNDVHFKENSGDFDFGQLNLFERPSNTYDLLLADQEAWIIEDSSTLNEIRELEGKVKVNFLRIMNDHDVSYHFNGFECFKFINDD